MKSFHIYLHKPVVPPARHATDYTEAENAALQEKFRPLAARYRRHVRRAGFAVGAFFLCIIAGAAFPALFTSFFIAGLCSWFFVVFSVSFLPRCPGCHNALEGTPGAYCPECGNRSMVPAGWFRAAHCTVCGKEMARRKGMRRCKIRACTHCGLFLDREGL